MVDGASIVLRATRWPGEPEGYFVETHRTRPPYGCGASREPTLCQLKPDEWLELQCGASDLLLAVRDHSARCVA